MGSRVEPGESPSEEFYPQLSAAKIFPVHVGDLELAPGAGGDVLRHGDDVVVVEVQAGDGEVAPGVFRLLLKGEGPFFGIELHHSVPFWVDDLVAEDDGSLLQGGGLFEEGRESRTVEYVVAEDEANGIVPNELLPQKKGLGKAVR